MKQSTHFTTNRLIRPVLVCSYGGSTSREVLYSAILFGTHFENNSLLQRTVLFYLIFAFL